MTDTMDPHPLLARVERFLAKSGMSAATFGLAAVGDPKFVYQLRKGREPRRKTVQRVTDWINNPTREAA